MSSVMCERPCPYNKGMLCGKDIVFITPYGQCNEHWTRYGQPMMIRDTSVEFMSVFNKHTLLLIASLIQKKNMALKKSSP